METPDPDPYASLISSLISVVFLRIDASTVIGLGVLLALLLLSALISGSETAFFSLKPADLTWLKSHHDKRSQRVLALREKPKKLLATILVSNNLANVSIVILASFLTLRIVDFGDNAFVAFLVQVVIITSLLLLLGEIMPKIYANHEPMKIALLVAPFMSFLVFLFKPLSHVLVSSTSFIDKRMGNKPNSISMSDLSVAIDITSNESTLPEEKKMLKGIASFGEKEVTNVMKSRVNITAIDVKTTFDQLLEVILNTGFSRIPVYDESLDKVLGLLYIKDLLPFLNHDDLDWVSMIRPAFFVPANKKINDLLQEFREKQIHMAIVVDEYGGTAGLLTLEDIIEEIVGEISDEFDKEPNDSFFRKLSADSYLFEGKTNLNDFCKVLELEDYYFDDVQGESDTLAGLLLELEGRILEKGSKTNCKDFCFEVTDADTRRIKQIKVTLRKNETY